MAKRTVAIPALDASLVAQAILKQKGPIPIGKPKEIKVGKEKLKISLIRSSDEQSKIDKFIDEIKDLKFDFENASEFDISFRLYQDIYVNIHGYWDINSISDWKKSRIIMDGNGDCEISFYTSFKSDITNTIVNILNYGCEDHDFITEMLYDTNEWKRYEKEIKRLLQETENLAKKIGISIEELYSDYIWQ